MPDLPVFVDVDGTLSADPHNPWGRPVWHRIEYLRAQIEQGREFIVWSANGEQYAKAFCKNYRIEAALCIGKPALCVDDNPTIRRPAVMQVLAPADFFGA